MDYEKIKKWAKEQDRVTSEGLMAAFGISVVDADQAMVWLRLALIIDQYGYIIKHH